MDAGEDTEIIVGRGRISLSRENPEVNLLLKKEEIH
jgi:hypothetical protein